MLSGPEGIQGTVLGATSTFQVGTVPQTGAVPLQSGPTVSCSDTLVTLTQPGTSGQFTATVAASDTNGSYQLAITGVNGAGATITSTFTIPILQPSTTQQVLAFSLDQLS